MIDSSLCVSVISASFLIAYIYFNPGAGSGVERIDPVRFLAECRKRQLNQARSVHSLTIVFSIFCRDGLNAVLSRQRHRQRSRKTASRPPRAEAGASRTTSLIFCTVYYVHFYIALVCLNRATVETL